RLGMARLLSQASLVTLLSEYEAHPIAVLEALSLGRPVLVSNTSGLHELAENNLAHEIPLNSSPEVIAHAIVENLRDPLIPSGISLPTWDDCVRALTAVYETSLVQDTVRSAAS